MMEVILLCLSLNVYFEARDQSVAGQVAVAQVTMNRVSSPNFPDDVCGVVYHARKPGLNRCQFSWYCDGRSDRVINLAAWDQAMLVASAVLAGSGHVEMTDVTHYHAIYVSPWWVPEMKLVATIGDHIFYQGGMIEEHASQDDIASGYIN